MKIVFNKVTWYSKLLAVFVFFVIVPLVSFYLGSYYEQTKIIIRNINEIAPVQKTINTKPIDRKLPNVKINPVVPIKPTEPTQGVICTMEAKLCSDGSYVGRTGPHCEFTPCPR